MGSSEIQAEGSERHRGTGKLRRLWRIRQEWKLLGFFEINCGHEFYDFTCMLKEGLKAAVQEAMDNPRTADILNEADFTAVLKQAHKGFEMRTYAGPAFSRFRDFLGMVDSDYQQSLSCESAYLQFITNSKSTANFFLTNDKRFFLKTQSKREIRFLLSNLAKYFEHLERYPHSFLVKFLGVHSIIVPQEKKKYFIIMQSVFYPHERIVERYDIKGCQLDRWVEASLEEGSHIIMVFKDLNFEGKTICLDEQRAWFMHQVELDTQFLKQLDVMDYSLLVAFQPLHEDEQAINRTLANIIARTKRSLNPHSSLLHGGTEPTDLACLSSVMQYTSSADQISNYTGSSLHEFLAYYMLQKSNFDLHAGIADHNDFFQEALITYLSQASSCEQLPKTLSGMEGSLTNIADSCLRMTQNRRLLPDSRNPLHVIDGPEFRYFVGIIDLFTVYGFRKKLEHLWKSIRYRGRSFSTVSPSHYARRLCQWVEEHTT
ncbi:phosphatidylinositol 4-phosphate 5-kinase-like protein 1 [Eublepharis macularius]|uniref:Phosphatidylinositol 4-phosphate 5-kinase-like protein 1 n=1 Tax=Eublepharis macularius TaxID=481883 RepID=A0AA97KBN8_EUBMA|nr:phosphatidylinositol 4-phosphate 5-kinase-like protein 1 [Eublepharis macularius]